MSRGRAFLGAAVLIASLQYLVAEAIAASAWRDSPYSYARNYISDLGVQGCGIPGGSRLCSPLAAVMNGGFVLAGLLAIGAALLLAPLLPGRLWRIGVVGLATTHGIGSVVVGLVHSAPGSAAGTPHLHVIGAYLAILGGNLALIAAGFALRRGRAPLRIAALGVGFGIFGLASATALVMDPFAPPGVLERMAVDPITAWEVATGIILAVALRRAAPNDPLTITDLRTRGLSPKG